MNIKEKYKQARPYIKNGDIVLFRGKRLLAKLIQYFDSAYYNHAGVIFKVGERVMIIDSNGKGVKPDFLSDRMNGYIDFCILSPKRTEVEVCTTLDKVLERVDNGTKYDFFLLPRIAIIKKIKIDFIGWGSERRNISSEFVRYYTDWLNILCYKNMPLITPQDLIRYRDKEEISLLFNDSVK